MDTTIAKGQPSLQVIESKIKELEALHRELISYQKLPTQRDL